MAKINKSAKVEPMIENVEKDESGKVKKVTMVMVNEPRYRNVPVDMITHRQLMALCEKKGFGQRGQGALVRVLIKQSYEAEFPAKK